jgi:alpha-tubulin suppressor-like RCC1 family protein
LSALLGDCNDENNQINPGKTEICDGIDNNCNGLIDEGVKLVFYKDLDGDGYTDGTTSVGCSAPQGYVLSATSGDCNDNDPNINPGKTEICDGKDNNCNGQIDEGFNVGQSCTVGVGECARTGQYVCKADGSGTQCNATPGAPTTEICDGKDNNCNGQIDEVCPYAPSNLTYISYTAYSVSLVWQDNSENEDGFIVEISTSEDFVSPLTHIFPANSTKGEIYALSGTQTYYFRVYAYNSNGKSAYSNVIFAPDFFKDVISVSSGATHTCAVKRDGSLWCWGWNGWGQIGDGTYVDKVAPVRVISSGVVSVSAGFGHTCAVKQDGSLWCWGRNYEGQIGDGTYSNKNIPVQIMSSGVLSVSLGGDDVSYGHTCAVKVDGSLWCWGDNHYGQLGNGTYGNIISTPVQIMSSGVSAVALGGSHTCIIKMDGSMWCWGGNRAGQLGDGTHGVDDCISTLSGLECNINPTFITTGVKSMSLGRIHTCAIKVDGSLWCWGYNGYGQLGDGTNSSKNTPIQIMSSGVSSVALGGWHTCAIKTDGSLWCWGLNSSGQLGNGTYTSSRAPVQIMSSGVSSVALGGSHTCAVKTDGSLWCWGYSGFLGDGVRGNFIGGETLGGSIPIPARIMLWGVSSVSLGAEHTCAIKTDGSLWCWGGGWLGNGTDIGSNTPIQIISSGVSSVALRSFHTCAIKVDGSLWCWGDNYYGQLGNGTYGNIISTPVQIMSSGVSAVALGGSHTCAIKTDGSLWCWGWNDYGQVGNGTSGGSITTPIEIMSSGVVDVSLGYGHTCAVKVDGSLWCWGDNYYGQLGNGTYGNIISTPVQIMSSGVVDVSAGIGYTCAIKQDGSLWCWGENSQGQLGDGTRGVDDCDPNWDGNECNINPTIIITGVKSVSLSFAHTCAIKQDGSLWCWGNNWAGQLGDGTYVEKSTPVQIMSSGVLAVSLGDSHTCAIKTDGSLWCWGKNTSGQLGVGWSAMRDTPVRVINPSGSGGGGAPSIRDESSFGNREQKQTNEEQKQTRYGCSSANIVFYVLHLIFPAFILFALLKRKLV